MLPTPRQSYSGFSLVETFICLGALGVGAFALMQNMQLGSKASKDVEVRYELAESVAQINSILSNPAACKKTFGGLNLASAATLGTIPDAIKFENNADSKFIEGAKLPSGIILKTIQVNFTGIVAMGSDWFTVPVDFTFGRPSSAQANKDITKTIDIQMKKTSAVVHTVTDCASFAIGQNKNTNIAICNGVTAGSQRYNSIIKQMEFCDGSVWRTSGVPVGSVLALNLTICPAGWIEANGLGGTLDLRGEFIRGLDNGRGVDPARALGSYQLQSIQSHTHNQTGVVYRNHIASPHKFQGGGPFYFNRAITGATGGVETRPRNIALLFCIKI